MLVRRGVYHLVLHRGRRLVGLLVDAKIVNLKPEIDLFFFGERGWLAVRRADLGPDLVRSDDEVSGTDFARRDWFHLVSKNQRGRSKLFVTEIGDRIAAAENTGFVAIHVFHYHIKPVKPRTHRQGLPIQ